MEPEAGALPDLECVFDEKRAEALLDPLRMRILAIARTPASATEIAARLRLPRQRVNYHVRRLADRGLLRRAGRQRKRNMFEQRYVAAARSFWEAAESSRCITGISPVPGRETRCAFGRQGPAAA